MIFLGALLVRLPGIDSRPFHTDEAVNAFIVEETLSSEGYHYRQNDHHGPTLFYLAGSMVNLAGVTRVCQMDAWMLRLVTAVCGAALAASVFLLRPALPRATLIGAAVFLGISAPFVYYSTYFIHEILLVLLLSGFIAATWRWRQTASARAAIAGGLLTGLLLATKETAAPMIVLLFAVLVPGCRLTKIQQIRGLALAAFVALVLVLLFFGAFGLHPERSMDLLSAIRQHIQRGTGNEHAYPFFTYFKWFGSPASVGLPWSGWLLVIFAAAGLRIGRGDTLTRRLGLCGILFFTLLSVLPYKTPWLMLAVFLPLSFLSGSGAASVWRKAHEYHRLLGIAFVAVLVMLLAMETYSRCLREPVSTGNPLAYSPSGPDLDRLSKDLELLAGQVGSHDDFCVQVVAHDYWPLPWTLRRYPRVGYWNEPPDALQPGVLIAGPEALHSTRTLTTFEPYQIRPGAWVLVAPIVAGENR